MSFPESARVTYTKNPLKEVICQIRFPTILRIDAELPAAFQDEIRADFPLYEEERPEEKIPQELLKQIPGDLRRLLPSIDASKVYDFKSLDKQWTVRLSRDSMSLTASKYTVWNEFESRLSLPLVALHRLYAPAIYTRVGLRYQNLIERSKLELNEVSWSELLNPVLTGILADGGLGTKVRNYVQVIEMELPDIEGTVTIRHGFATAIGSTEVSYLIDSDFYATDIKERGDVEIRLRAFNQESGRLFRWSISPKLSDALEPRTIR